jgi:hypothetical protein
MAEEQLVISCSLSLQPCELLQYAACVQQVVQAALGVSVLPVSARLHPPAVYSIRNVVVKFHLAFSNIARLLQLAKCSVAQLSKITASALAQKV